MKEPKELDSSTSGFLPDTPLSGPEQNEDNMLGRWPFAQRLAGAIAAHSNPSSLVLAVYGAWGCGKTSVLNFVKAELELAHHEHVICMEFNPWLFADEAQLLRSFFSRLAATLDKPLTTNKERLGEFFLTSIGNLLSKYAESVLPASPTQASIAILPGKCLSKIGKMLGKDKDDLDKLREKIDDILSKSNKRVVIFMDDIDRLDNSEIHAVFKLVKLTANFKNTTYVLAFDNVMVAKAQCRSPILNHRFGELSYGCGSGCHAAFFMFPPYTSSGCRPARA